jgi:hypothetical protein
MKLLEASFEVSQKREEAEAQQAARNCLTLLD